MITLREFCRERGKSANFVASLERCLGRPAVVEDLDAETFERFTAWLATQPLSPATMKAYGDFLLAVWRHAADEGIVAIDEPYARKPRHVLKAPKKLWPEPQPGPLSADSPLADFIRQAHLSTATRKTERKFLQLVEFLTEAIGRAPLVRDLNQITLAALTFKLRHQKRLAVETVGKFKQHFRALWRNAAEHGFVPDLGRAACPGGRRSGRVGVLTERVAERIGEAAAMRARGKSWAAIAKRFNLTPEAVKGWQKRHRAVWDDAYDRALPPQRPTPPPEAAGQPDDRPSAEPAPVPPGRTVRDVLDAYLLAHDLKDTTADFYRRMVNVLIGWAGRVVSADEFTPELVNAMLLAKQKAGLSPYYRKTLRSAMRALLGHKYGGLVTGKLRSVKLEPLAPETWSADEVQRLIDACMYMKSKQARRWWQTLIEAAYYTGISTCDLLRLTLGDIDRSGIVRIRRSKTGKPVAMRLPLVLLSKIKAMAPKSGPIWGEKCAPETFRQTFRRIVRKAGLTGTFKRLRKSCGTSVEMRHPGRGHIALGNTRKVFEAHYLSRREFDENPLGPEELAAVG